MTKTLLALALLVSAIAAAVPGAAVAQDQRAMALELERLRTELRELQGVVYGGRPAPAGAAAAARTAPGGDDDTRFARLTVRLDQFDSQLRQLTGDVERARFETNRLERRLDKLMVDLDVRFKELATRIDRQQSAPAAAAPADDPAAAPSAPQAAATAGTTPQAAAPAAATPPATGVLPDGPAMQQYEFARALIGKQDFAGATKAFRAFLGQHPTGDLTDNAWFWLGMAEFFQGAYDEAAKAFLTTVTEYPKGNKAPEALYRLGVSLNKLGQTQDACGALGEVARRYPEADKRILEQTQRAAADIGCG